MITMMDQELKHTPLYERHIALRGKMVNFSGFELPIYYTSIMEEHLKVRQQAAMFDVSHLGEIRVTGKQAFSFLQRVVPTDLEKLADSHMMYSVVLNEAGGILDDILIYRLNAEAFYLVVNAGNISKITDHLSREAGEDVEISDESEQCACVAVQGPKAAAVCDAVMGGSPSALGYYQFQTLAGWDEKVWISRSGYTGEDGFEFFADPATILKVWDRFMEEGKKLGLTPAGLGARNTLRLEVGNGLYAADFDETTTPFEVRLGWLVDKEKDFIGKKALLERKAAGFKEKLCGFKVNHKAVARDGYTIFKDDRKIGAVTSGSFSPSLKSNIGLARIDKESAGVGTMIDIEIHGRKIPAEIVKLPFVPIRHSGVSGKP